MEWQGNKTVIAPVDLEDSDDHGIRLAIDAAGGRAEDVHAVYVLPELEPTLLARLDDETRTTHARKALQTWLQERGLPDGVHTHASVGSAAQVIATLAETVSADLVVVASHGRRGIRRAMLGSVAERVTRLAPCPVLVLRHQTTTG